MLRRPLRRVWTEQKVSKRIRLGYGQGELAKYIPWISTRDLSSFGTATRLWSPKTGRTMQFLSNVERNTFLLAEFRADFLDYWEQWPLDRRWTAWAAEQLGLRHPIYPGTTQPVVMTVDGVVAFRRGDGVVRISLDCKHSSDKFERRTLEKLAIARLASERFAYPHKLSTNASYSDVAIRNILWVRAAAHRPFEVEPVPGAFDMWPMRMHRRLLQRVQSDQAVSTKVVDFCKEFDAENGLPRGLGLRCMKLLMWQHLVEFDIKLPSPEMRPLAALRVLPTAIMPEALVYPKEGVDA